jgi:DHA2 family methylenomycin A resistance protein-like MFS transporter
MAQTTSRADPGGAAATAPPARAQPSRRLVLIVMCAGYFLVLLDVTVVNVALPRIGAGLHAGVSSLQWVVDAYAIALASLMMAAGTLGDLHGHRRIVLTGLAVFGCASLGCGLAPSSAWLIALRAVQGVGAALMLPGTLAVITNAFPDRREQAGAIGLWAGIGSAALPAGPLLGGALTQVVSWRAVFFINVPIVAAALTLAWRTVTESRDPAGRQLDVPGVALAAGVLALVTFAFIQAGRAGLDAAVIAAVVAAVVLGTVFVGVERRQAHPMLPLALFARPAFSVANAVAAAMNLCTLGLLFVLSLYLQDVRHDSALSAGLALFPLFMPLVVLAPLAGRLTARVGPRGPTAGGLGVAAVGVALLALLGRHSSYLELFPALLLWGGGLGVLTPAVVAAAIRAVPDSRAGLASAVNNTSRQASGAIGIAAFGALAGAPAAAGFLSGLRTAAVLAAGLFVAAAAASLIGIRDT